MRIVFINSIYPNPVEPAKGNFVLKNLMHYPAEIDLEVIAPVPFFLSWRRRKAKRVPFMRYETLGIRKMRVWHPRFLLMPRNFLRACVPSFEFCSVLPVLWFLNRRKSIDTLHANFCVPDGIATRKLGRTLKLPYLITEHQGHLAEIIANPYLKRKMITAYNQAHCVIVVSERLRKVLIPAGVKPNQITVIPNGIDTSLFLPCHKPCAIKKLISISYLVENKGIQVLLKALNLHKDKSLSLSIVGDGVYRHELEELCSELGFADRVKFLGEKNPDEVAKLLSEHDALVHPSFIESFGIVVVEAMASGLPVLATINGGSEDILTAQTGILVPARDAHALAEGIEKLINTSWDSGTISDYALQKYDIRKVVTETVRQYPSSTITRKVCHLSSVHIRSDVRVFYKQCLTLAKSGYKIHLVVADGIGDENRSGVRIHDLGSSGSRKLRMLKAPLQILFKALLIKADIYQIHDPELIPVACLLKALTRKPVIYDVHECYPEIFLHKEYLSAWQGTMLSRGIRILEKMAANYLDGIIAATEHIAEQFKEALVLHNYPLLREWENVPDNPQRYHNRQICYLGNITKERGLSQLVMALEHVDCTLHLAGYFEPASYGNELRALPGFDKVIEHGYVNRGQAAAIFAQCAMGVVLLDRKPNNLYSLSTKMFEYMASGLPILVSDLPANKELVDRTACGVYLNPSNIKNISRTIDEMLAQPELLAAMGAKGKRAVETEFFWESEAPAYLEFYQTILKENKK